MFNIFFLQSNDFLEYTLNLTENVIVQLNTYSSEKHKKNIQHQFEVKMLKKLSLSKIRQTETDVKIRLIFNSYFLCRKNSPK